MIRRRIAAFATVALLWMTSGPLVQADDLIVEKKTFALPSYTTVAGESIKSLKVGWESAGTLSSDKSNAILITHFFSAPVTPSANTAPKTKRQAIGMRSLARARPSIPTNISCCPPTRSSISTLICPTSSPPDRQASTPTLASPTG